MLGIVLLGIEPIQHLKKDKDMLHSATESKLISILKTVPPEFVLDCNTPQTCEPESKLSHGESKTNNIQRNY